MTVKELHCVAEFLNRFMTVLDSVQPWNLQQLREQLVSIRVSFLNTLFERALGNEGQTVVNMARSFNIFQHGIDQTTIIRIYGSIMGKLTQLTSLLDEMKKSGIDSDEFNATEAILESLTEISDLLVRLTEGPGVRGAFEMIDRLIQLLTEIDKLRHRLAYLDTFLSLIEPDFVLPPEYEVAEVMLHSGKGVLASDASMFFDFLDALYSLAVQSEGYSAKENPLIIERLYIGSVTAWLAGLGIGIRKTREALRATRPSSTDDMVKAIEEELKLRDAVAAGRIPEQDASTLIKRLRNSARPIVEFGFDMDDISFSKAEPKLLSAPKEEQKQLGSGTVTLMIEGPKSDGGEKSEDEEEDSVTEEDDEAEEFEEDDGEGLALEDSAELSDVPPSDEC